jgi:hypothetical protein
MRLVAQVGEVESTMTKDKSPEKSYALAIVASLVIALLITFVRAAASGDTEVSAFAAASTAPASTLTRGADEVSMLAVGAFLLGLGSVLRRVA